MSATKEERIEAALATVGRATDGPWDLVSVGEKIKKLCPAHEYTSLLTVSIEHFDDDDDDPTYFGAVYKDEDATLIAAAPDLRDEVIALREKLTAAERERDEAVALLREARESYALNWDVAKRIDAYLQTHMEPQK